MAEPFQESGPTPFPVLAPAPKDALDPENVAVDPQAIEPGTGKSPVRLSEANRALLDQELRTILQNHDTAMMPRIKRWSQISANYNLQVDPATTGRMPFSQKLVSEMTRTHTNIASSRLVSAIFAAEPMVGVSVWDDQAAGQDTDELVAEAKALEEFWDNYFQNEMRARKWLRMALHRSPKLGAAVVRVRWDRRPFTYHYRSGSKVKSKTVDKGKLVADLINNEQVILWPLHALDIADCEIVGHRSYETASSFRNLAARLGLPADLTAEVLQVSINGPDDIESRTPLLKDLEGKDIRVLEAFTLQGEVPITELWLQSYLLPGEQEPGNYQVFYSEKLERCLWIGPNPYRCQRHGYFLIPYWREDNCVWPSGVGHETMNAHKADSALWNMLLDNLKVVGNVLRIVKAGQMAETFQDQIMPGGTIVTEEPSEDFVTQSLGGDLSWILQVMQENQRRGSLSSNSTAIEHGLGDPTLKSGASPGSIAQLREGSSAKFKHVDTDVREVLADMCLFGIEMIQQYATSGILYERASEESARRILRGKYRAPDGDIRSTFRITPKAPSATSNEEVLLNRLMLTFQMVGGYLPMAYQLIDQTFAAENPTGAQRLKKELFEFYNNEIFKSLIERQEIAGLGGKVPKYQDQPMDEQINQLLQQNQQLQQQVQQLAEQAQMAAMQQQQGVPFGA